MDEVERATGLEARRSFLTLHMDRHFDLHHRAFAEALSLPQAAGGTFNIGSGQDRSVRDVARALGEAMAAGLGMGVF